MRVRDSKVIAAPLLVVALPILAAGGALQEGSSAPASFLVSSRWTTVLTTTDGRPIRKNFVLDPQAESTDPEKPAFLAPPDGAGPYYGHPVVPESCIDGYCYGAITDFLQADDEDGCTIADAFVQAPDGSRAGLIWEVRREIGHLIVERPDNRRWGVYYFGIPSPILTKDDLIEMFKGILPALKKLHEQARGR